MLFGRVTGSSSASLIRRTSFLAVSQFGKCERSLLRSITGMRSINLQHILKITEPSALIAENSFADRLQEMPEVLRSFRAFFLKNPAKTPDDAQIGSSPCKR